MSEDTLRKYHDLLAQRDMAWEKLERITRTITEVSEALKDPWPFSIKGTSILFPAECISCAKYTLSAPEWPTAAQLADVLASWQFARIRAKNLYPSVPEPDRQNMPEP